MDTKADVYLPQSCDGNKVFLLKNWIFVQGPKNANSGGIISKRQKEKISGVILIWLISPNRDSQQSELEVK